MAIPMYSSSSPQGSLRVSWDPGDYYCGKNMSTIWSTSKHTITMVSGTPTLPHGQWPADASVSALELPTSLPVTSSWWFYRSEEKEWWGGSGYAWSMGQGGCALLQKSNKTTLLFLLVLGILVLSLGNWDLVMGWNCMVSSRLNLLDFALFSLCSHIYTLICLQLQSLTRQTHGTPPITGKVFSHPEPLQPLPSCGGISVSAAVLSCLYPRPQLILFQRQQWGPSTTGIYFNAGFLPGLCHL